MDLYPDRSPLTKTRKQILMERLFSNKELVIVIIGLIVLEIILAGAKLYRYIKKWAIKKNNKRAYTKPRYRYKK